MKFLFITSLLANVAVLLWALYSSVAADPELANKEEWSILQIIESRYRNKSPEPDLKMIVDFEGTGYDAVGILDPKTSTRAWILTNSKISPKIKLLPKITELTVSESQVKLILNGVKTNDEIKSFLSIKRH